MAVAQRAILIRRVRSCLHQHCFEVNFFSPSMNELLAKFEKSVYPIDYRKKGYGDAHDGHLEHAEPQTPTVRTLTDGVGRPEDAQPRWTTSTCNGPRVVDMK